MSLFPLAPTTGQVRPHDAGRTRLMERCGLALGAAALPVATFALGMGNITIGACSIAAVLAGTGLYAWAHRHAGAGRDARGVAGAETLKFLMDNMRDAALQYGAGGDMLFCSPSVRKLLGCEAYELTGSGLLDRVHVLDKPLWMTAFAQAQQDGRTRTIELRMRKDGENTQSGAPVFAWMEADIVPVREAADRTGPFAVVVTLHDVTNRRNAEKRLEDIRKSNEEASQAKNQFLAVIGHELRTPLNAIVGFSDMMANGIGGKLEPAHLEYVQLISQSGHHLLEMVNMLLDMSKIEAGRFELQAEYFEPEKLVAPCVQMVSKAAAEKSIELNVELGRSLPEIRADERACRQMIINLLSNAIKFTDTGGRVTWSMRQRGNKLAITVKDTGIGMSQDVLDRLGEPFFQAQNSAARRYEGTGLGMSIVKGLVELHEGAFDVKSVPGEGTAITILLHLNGPETISVDSETVASLQRENEPKPRSTPAAEQLRRSA